MDEFTPEEIKERGNLAYKLAKEVVEEFNIPTIEIIREPGYQVRPFELFRSDESTDIRLHAQINSTMLGPISFFFSLVHPALHMILLLQTILSDETAPQSLKPSVIYELRKKKINILTLFDLKESEIQEAIESHTKEVLKMFIANIESFVEAAIVDAFGYTILGYYQHFIKPDLKDHWETLGLPDDFDIITSEELEEVRKHNLDEKRWFLGDKKQFLNLENLAYLYNELKEEYTRAKTEYYELEKAFFLLNKNAGPEKWKDKWRDLYSEYFPNLHPKLLDSIEKNRPFELACMHLAELYDYDDDTMKKKITASKKLLSKRKKEG